MVTDSSNIQTAMTLGFIDPNGKGTRAITAQRQ
jgi:hypothetical protein